jgi:curved DNA-binding protein
MEFKDYYAALGVLPDADDQAIKQAYRKLARQYHPDVNPGDTQAEERFKEVNEAYQALSDAERRRTYDEMREQYQRWQQRGGTGDFSYGQWQDAPGGVYARTVNPEDFEDLFGGNAGFSDFFSSLFGQGSGGGARAYDSQPRRGRTYEVGTEVTLEEAYHGATRTIQLGDRRIEARIPPGVQTGSRIRLAGQGAPGAAGGPAGDLLLEIEVLPDARFERDGDDLITEVPVDFLTAAVGGDARVQTLDGTVRLKIPAITQAGTRFRLREKGMPRLGNPGQRGSLYARVKIVLPEDLSDTELEMLREMQDHRHEVSRVA